MNWIKQGLLLPAPVQASWAASHAALPVVVPQKGSHLLYFSARDEQGRAHIGHAEIDLSARRVLSVGPEPSLGLGALGAFDDSGVTSSWVLRRGTELYHYYSGWSLGVTVPFYLAIGLAVSSDGGRTYHRVSHGPVVGRDTRDPYLAASPCILIDNGIWRMWYVSGSRWESRPDGARHYYHIRYAESADGIDWRRDGTVCIDYQSESEHAIARPCVVKDGNVYRMWYCYRGARYAIGYAESQDGIVWRRMDAEAGLPVSESGWDSGMVAYAFVFDDGDRRYMLYNGNGYGQTGIGLAVLRPPA